MRRATWTDEGLEILDAEPGPLLPGWVRLRVEACGICGSDLHVWHGHLGRPLGTSPGHELAGVVVDGPAGLADVRYAVSPNVTCGTCTFCAALVARDRAATGQPAAAHDEGRVDRRVVRLRRR